MAAFEIPDSDDEEEGGFAPSPHPIAGDGPAEDPDQRPDAMRSGSTDPAFFQSVYDEHKEAVRQVSRAAKPQPEMVAKDPYDIPSSPEMATKKRKSSGRDLTDLNVGDSEGRISPQANRKKRRLDEDADEVSLVKVPTPNEETSWEHTNPYSEHPGYPNDALPSTLDPLQVPSDTPQVQHLPIMDSSGFPPTQDQGPSAAGRGGLIKSSGSATNINTQRSIPPSMPPDNATQENAGPKSNDPIWPGSSPDLLTAAMTPRQSRRGRNKPSKVSQMTPVVEDWQPDELDAPVLPPAPGSPGFISNEEPVVAKKAAKGKKQRGRPKKNAVQEPPPENADFPEAVNEAIHNVPAETPKENITPEEAPNGIAEAAPPQQPDSPKSSSKKPEKKPKKKRGRPKKSDKEEPDTKKQFQETAPVHSAGQNVKPDVQDHIDPEPATTSNDKGREVDLGPTKPKADNSIEKDKEEKKEEEELSKTTARATPVAESKKAPAKPNSIGASSTPGNKPIYRVGLSKRSRIAPLLKIVRKD